MSAYSLVWLKWRDIGAVAPAARLEVMVLFITLSGSAELSKEGLGWLTTHDSNDEGVDLLPLEYLLVLLRINFPLFNSHAPNC